VKIELLLNVSRCLTLHSQKNYTDFYTDVVALTKNDIKKIFLNLRIIKGISWF